MTERSDVAKAMGVFGVMEDDFSEQMDVEPLSVLRGVLYYLRQHYPDDCIRKEFEHHQFDEQVDISLPGGK